MTYTLTTIDGKTDGNSNELIIKSDNGNTVTLYLWDEDDVNRLIKIGEDLISSNPKRTK